MWVAELQVAVAMSWMRFADVESIKHMIDQAAALEAQKSTPTAAGAPAAVDRIAVIPTLDSMCTV
jgi:hypothetical protein